MNKHRILLIRPPVVSHQALSSAERVHHMYHIPISILYLATTLSHHFEISILDYETLHLWSEPAPLEAAKEVLIKSLDDLRPFMVGISCQSTPMLRTALELAETVKDFQPAVNVVMGGIPPTVFSQSILLECPQVDYVLKGEGDHSVVELALALSNGDLRPDVDGLTFRDPAGQVVDQPKRSYIQNLDTLPRPAYELFDFDAYRSNDFTLTWHNPKNLPIVAPIGLFTSRGCTQNCNFCTRFHSMGAGYRVRSARHVLDEIEWLYHERGSRYFFLHDDSFSASRRRTLEICRGIVERKLDIQLSTTAGMAMNTLDTEVVDALVEAGLVWMTFALESGSDHIRNQVMGKRLPVKRLRQCVADFKRHREVMLIGMFIMGMPEDTPETLMDTYHLIEELGLDRATLANAVPYHGTALYRQCLQDGLLLFNPDEWRNGELWNSGRGGQQFFLKPYRMQIEELAAHRQRLDKLIDETKSERFRRLSSESAQLAKNLGD